MLATKSREVLDSTRLPDSVLSALYQIQDKHTEYEQAQGGEKIEETTTLDRLLERLAFLLVLREDFLGGAFGRGGIGKFGRRVFL